MPATQLLIDRDSLDEVRPGDVIVSIDGKPVRPSEVVRFHADGIEAGLVGSGDPVFHPYTKIAHGLTVERG